VTRRARDLAGEGRKAGAGRETHEGLRLRSAQGEQAASVKRSVEEQGEITGDR